MHEEGMLDAARYMESLIPGLSAVAVRKGAKEAPTFVVLPVIACNGCGCYFTPQHESPELYVDRLTWARTASPRGTTINTAGQLVPLAQEGDDDGQPYGPYGRGNCDDECDCHLLPHVVADFPTVEGTVADLTKLAEGSKE